MKETEGVERVKRPISDLTGEAVQHVRLMKVPAIPAMSRAGSVGSLFRKPEGERSAGTLGASKSMDWLTPTASAASLPTVSLDSLTDDDQIQLTLSAAASTELLGIHEESDGSGEDDMDDAAKDDPKKPKEPLTAEQLEKKRRRQKLYRQRKEARIVESAQVIDSLDDDSGRQERRQQLQPPTNPAG